MGGAVSTVNPKLLFPSEIQLEALHGLHLSTLSDDDINHLVQAFNQEDLDKRNLIDEIENIQGYLTRLKKALVEAPTTIVAIPTQAEEKQLEDRFLSNNNQTVTKEENESKVVNSKPINLGSDGTLSPFCVSLEFFFHFLNEHPEAENMTTAEVVYKIIVPETRESKLTYVEAKLVGKYPQYFRVMEPLKERKSVAYSADVDFDEFSFLSHAWSMPFRTVIDIAESATRRMYTGFQHVPTRDEYFHRSFFWMDVFCKNQHIPAPAMNEFETAMKLSNNVVLAIYPLIHDRIDFNATREMKKQKEEQLKQDVSDGKIPQPIVLTRIWCLFEIMTCINMKKSLMPCVPDDDLTDLRSDLFMIDVEKAQATVPADIELILGLIKSTVGIEKMNKQVKTAVTASLQTQLHSMSPFDPGCFEGDGLVYVPVDDYSSDTFEMTKRCVKDLRRGDKVLTCIDPSVAYSYISSIAGQLLSSLITQYPSLFAWATVSLVTKDDVSSFNQKHLPDNDPMSLWDVQGLTITAEHPLWDPKQGIWVKAREFKGAVRSEKTLNYVYNVELEANENTETNTLHTRYGNVLVNDVMVMTLGHGYDFDAETDKLYGYGWHDNPKRVRDIKLQELCNVDSIV